MGRIRQAKKLTEPTLLPGVSLKRKATTIPHKSFSQIDMYIKCGYKYKLNYMMEKIYTPAIDLIIGDHGHKYFENVLGARLNHHDYSSTQLMDAMKNAQDALIKEINKAIADYNITPKLPPEVIRDFFYRSLQKWNADILPEIDPVAIESYHELTIDGELFIIYIDLTRKLQRGELEIVDWKWSKKKKSVYEANSSLQLSIYALATGITNVNFVSIIKPDPKTNYKNWVPRIEQAKSTRTQGDLKWAEIVIKDALAGIRAGYFPKCSPEHYLCTPEFCIGWEVCRGAMETKAPNWLE